MLTKIISWKPFIFENRKKNRYKCLQSRFWIFIHFYLSFCIFIHFFRMDKTWKNKKRTCFERLFERLLKAYWKPFESLLKAFWKLLKSPCRPLSLKNMLFFVYPTNCCIFAKEKSCLTSKRMNIEEIETIAQTLPLYG